ncbi:hypothetical protein R3P38DRAFT_2857603 [Favolaschia claudopus]|uniref:Uncharacterized protein n=1 Tax=Favolaschia claudopus TaxID=2862362 RepID=A0AAW0DL10_9AGAR
MTDRSNSRSRDPVTSSGRGGMGNIRPASDSRERPVGGPDDFSDTRGREPAVAISEVRSTGRGGAGNFRSPSRDVADDRDVRGLGEREVIRAHEEQDREGVYSTGRGGMGNMSRSRSRGGEQLVSPSPSRTNSTGPVHSSGRGGAGNIAPGPAPPYERGRTVTADLEGVHSTGRGGIANLTSSHAPPPEQIAHHPGEYESSGRGGAGNMSRSRERTSSKERSSGIAGLWNRMQGHGHHPETIQEGNQPAGLDGGVDVTVGGGGRGAI